MDKLLLQKIAFVGLGMGTVVFWSAWVSARQKLHKLVALLVVYDERRDKLETLTTELGALAKEMNDDTK